MHAMFDVETLGTSPDTIVVSLGAVLFTRSKGIVAKQLFEFDLDDQVNRGRTFTASTLSWWYKQDSNARQAFHWTDRQIALPVFFEKFEAFLADGLQKADSSLKNLMPWGKGADFDVAILADMFRRHHPKRDLAIPWRFSNVWCYRTFANMTKCEDLVRREGTHHNALDDALHQTKCVFAYWDLVDKRKAASK